MAMSVRYPDPVAGHRLQHAEREQVVGAEHRGRPGRGGQPGQLGAGPLPGRHVQRRGLEHVQVILAAPGPLQGPHRAFVPVGDLPDAQRAADERDLLVPLVQQVGHGQVAAEHVVH